MGLSFATTGLGKLRFTSFDGCGRDSDVSCTFSDNAYYLYPMSELGSISMAFSGYEYDVSWTGADPDYPVRLTWHFPLDYDYKKDIQLFHPEPNTIRWAYNVSDGDSFTWRPHDMIAKDFPSEFTNMTGDQVLGFSGFWQWTFFGLSQPESPTYSDDYFSDAWYWSTGFTLQSQVVEQFLDVQNENGHAEEGKRWRLGVGVGVGVGVPILLAAASFVGYLFGSKAAKAKVPLPVQKGVSE